jgi:hypothetical protein
LISCQASMGHVECVLQELKHGVMFVWMLLRNKFIVTIKILYIHLFIWKQKGWFVNLL